VSTRVPSMSQRTAAGRKSVTGHESTGAVRAAALPPPRRCRTAIVEG
jgi:hypothetical protein